MMSEEVKPKKEESKEAAKRRFLFKCPTLINGATVQGIVELNAKDAEQYGKFADEEVTD